MMRIGRRFDPVDDLARPSNITRLNILEDNQHIFPAGVAVFHQRLGDVFNNLFFLLRGAPR